MWYVVCGMWYVVCGEIKKSDEKIAFLFVDIFELCCLKRAI
jgi:hypothetical protein